jgi:uncharacterized flavoprotein (TIGR03862 family)
MTIQIAIIGAGPAGLACAERLSEVAGLSISVFEQKPSAARKFLMAGKTGLNISHHEDIERFIARYDQPQRLAPMIRAYDAEQIQAWMADLGIQSYVGSSGRIFPKEMKAAPLLRAWLARLRQRGVQFFYQHQVTALQHTRLSLYHSRTQQQRVQDFDAVVMACGALSWPQLGSDGAWQNWLPAEQISPFVASNVGVEVAWSEHMQTVFGQPLKRIQAWAAGQAAQFGEMVISHYGLEGGLVYRCNRDLRLGLAQQGSTQLYVDLLPDQSVLQLQQKLGNPQKRSLSSLWRKLGLDAAKMALLRDVLPKDEWHDATLMAQRIKCLAVQIQGLRPITEAISCAGGLQWSALDANLALIDRAGIFACGEMLDWDAPTGGYLLSACLATGRQAAQGVLHFIESGVADLD